jgi:hypothetical protein
MKKGLLFAGMIAIAGIAMTGCSSLNTNDAAAGTKVAMIPAVYEPVIKHTNVKVQGSAKLNVLFGIFTWGVSSFADRTNIEPTSFMFFMDTKNMVKQGAVYNACKSAKCDMLLNSKYEITTVDYFVFKTIDCKVSGFPAVEVDIVKKEAPKDMKPIPLF